MLQFAALIVNKGVAFSDIMMVFAAIVPTFLEIALPMATLLGIMLAFARLSGDSEIIIMRASGISLSQLLKPIIIFGFIATAANLYVSLELRPWGNFKLAQSFFEIARSKSTAGLSAGIFNKLGNLTLYAEKINDKNGSLEKVVIDDQRAEDSRKIIVAESGSITSDSNKRTIVLILNNGHIHEEIDRNYVLTNFTSNNLVIDFNELYTNSEINREKKSREMYIHEIKNEIDKFSSLAVEAEAQGGNFSKLPQEAQESLDQVNASNMNQLRRHIRRLNTEAGRRYSTPIATFILALLGLPLGIVPPRTQKTWGAGLSMSLGLGVFTLYYFLLSLGITFGESGKIDTHLGLWIPNVIAASITAFVIYKVTSEKWYSIAHGFELLLEKLFSKLRLSKAK